MSIYEMSSQHSTLVDALPICSYMYIFVQPSCTRTRTPCGLMKGLINGLTEGAGVPREEEVGGAPGQSPDQATLVALHTVVPATRAVQLQGR